MKGDGADWAALDSAIAVLLAEAARGVARLRENSVSEIRCCEFQKVSLLFYVLGFYESSRALFKGGSGQIG